MRSIFRYLRKKRFQYEPLAEITISKDALLHNLETLRNLSGGFSIAPVLKSNAYGHGLIQIAKILDRKECPFLIVDSYYEALVLRNEKIISPILIIGFTLPENIIKNRLKNIAFTIGSIQELEGISHSLKEKKSFHLKIDTGMRRQGILPQELDKAFSIIERKKNITLEGIFTHLADPYEKMPAPAVKKQVE